MLRSRIGARGWRMVGVGMALRTYQAAMLLIYKVLGGK